MTMRITQGTFSFLPDLTNEQIRAQIQYCLDHDWPIAIEHTHDPHPRNVYWDMWGNPMFEMKDAAAIMLEIEKCREAFPDSYIRVNGFDRSHNRATTVLSFIIQRPRVEPELSLERTEVADRQIRYTIRTGPGRLP
jgi:ribulose-bisphosphate carboxylase small chain